MGASTNGGRAPDGRATRWAGQRERRRAEFVDAAIEAVALHGPEVSTEQIAEQAGVARTRLYKHFSDAADLNRALVERVTEMIAAELEPVLYSGSTPRDGVEAAVRTHLQWLTRHSNLYRYLLRQTADSPSGAGQAVHDVKSAMATMLAGLFRDYTAAFELDMPAQWVDVLAFGIVGLIEAATSRWMADPSQITEDELAQRLSRWVWLTLDDALRAEGIELDPDVWLPLPPPSDSASAPTAQAPTPAAAAPPATSD
ncbi:TetR/AcrR family transcriptional regulator [Streptomyces sp. NA04227]|uniref:TetR/AcrR family transcriptional regulator n=1 Tax=Streptomyces sp. NA04227 TaxID=2742136 RepID=UPI001591FF6D|nr:TetR/AcrR family transcriptional regulator [Streptomyces sp. NA04227]QKW06098.1 TetR/AcrR family transcriptional regulator [Streptomyces sp. NA04227]